MGSMDTMIRLYGVNYPTEFVDRTLFKAQSYAAFALEELSRYAKRNEGKNVMEIVEDFRYKMDEFAANANTEEANFAFSCMYDSITDFLDYIIANETRF